MIRVRAVIYTHSLGVDAKEEVYASGSLADVGKQRKENGWLHYRQREQLPHNQKAKGLITQLIQDQEPPFLPRLLCLISSGVDLKQRRWYSPVHHSSLLRRE